MVTEAVMDFLFSLFDAVFGWLGEHLPTPPTFWSDMTTALTTVTETVESSVLYFLPVGPAITAGLALLALVVGLGLLRLVRRAVSLFTGGGGA